MKQKVIKVGNSSGVILTKKLMKSVGLKTGEEVFVQKTALGDLVISKKEREQGISDDFVRILKKINKDYASDLQELANR